MGNQYALHRSSSYRTIFPYARSSSVKVVSNFHSTTPRLNPQCLLTIEPSFQSDEDNLKLNLLPPAPFQEAAGIKNRY